MLEVLAIVVIEALADEVLAIVEAAVLAIEDDGETLEVLAMDDDGAVLDVLTLEDDGAIKVLVIELLEVLAIEVLAVEVDGATLEVLAIEEDSATLDALTLDVLAIDVLEVLAVEVLEVVAVDVFTLEDETVVEVIGRILEVRLGVGVTEALEVALLIIELLVKLLVLGRSITTSTQLQKRSDLV